jgi:hypothetical protein
MSIVKTARMFGAVTVLVSASALSAMAQTTEPSSPTPPSGTPPAATKPAPTPPKSTTAPTQQKHALVGLAAFSSDGSRVGSVDSVSTDSDGKVKAIHLKTGGFLGIGGRLVAIPDGKFTKSGENVQLGMTSEEVSKLPTIKDQS